MSVSRKYHKTNVCVRKTGGPVDFIRWGHFIAFVPCVRSIGRSICLLSNRNALASANSATMAWTDSSPPETAPLGQQHPRGNNNSSDDDDVVVLYSSGYGRRARWTRCQVRRRGVVGSIVVVVVFVGLILSLVLVRRNRSIHEENNSTVKNPILKSDAAATAEAIGVYINGITLTGRTIATVPYALSEQQQALLPVEEMALQWLMYHPDDRWNRENDGSGFSSRQQFLLRQRYALLTLWFLQHQVTPTTSISNINNEFPVPPKPDASFSSTTDSFSGQPNKSWSNVSGWITDPNECHWFGVECSSITAAAAATTEDLSNTVDAVTSIRLNFNNLQGKLSTELGLLSHLTTFRVNTNRLRGALPHTLGLWTDLQEFAVYKNALTGSLVVPTQPTTSNAIVLWPRIQTVLCEENQFSSSLPSFIGAWTELRTFRVSRNALTGSIPSSIGNWKNIVVAHFSVNQLNGTLPTTLGQWTNVEEFKVASNAVTGPIPESLNRWQSIREAYFHDNALTGTMPLCLSNASSSSATTMAVSANLSSLVADCASKAETCPCCTYCFQPQD